jgi:hypothetical protein
MDFLQNIDINTALPVVIICVILCGIGIFLFFGMQLISTSFGVILGFVELFINVVTGGPVAWCGCALLLFACAICAGIVLLAASVLPTCGTSDAVNFCQILGR